MWDLKILKYLDLKLVVTIFFLMGASLLVISSVTKDPFSKVFFTPYVIHQLGWFLVGILAFFAAVVIDFRKYLQLAPFFYFIALLLLIGLFFTTPIHTVQRWYKLPFLPMTIQPSEYTKIALVLFLAWFLEKNSQKLYSLRVILGLAFFVGIPFLLILKQPDLGTALVLFPIALAMFRLAKVHPFILKAMNYFALVASLVVFLIFSDILSHSRLKPYFTKFIKEYQYERLNPNSYHRKAAITSIAAAGLTGSGWNKSEFASQKWLPAAHTDSVVAVFTEEFGFIGLLFLLFLFYSLLASAFRVILSTRDTSARLLAYGVAVYLAMHILGNILMMCGFLPISGVPLTLLSYGGSSTVTTMIALGILQSIYTRRFLF